MLNATSSLFKETCHTGLTGRNYLLHWHVIPFLKGLAMLTPLARWKTGDPSYGGHVNLRVQYQDSELKPGIPVPISENFDSRFSEPGN